MSSHADPLNRVEHLSLPGITAERDALLAENQRLREALEEACDWLDVDLAEHPGAPSDLQLADRALIARWREALAGDADD